MSAWLANRYWALWFTVLLVSFLVPEVYSLVVKKPQGTLSDTIWRLEKFDPAHGLTVWTAFHFLFIGGLILVFAWLIFHLGWRLFT